MEQPATLSVGRDGETQIDQFSVTYRLMARRVLYLQPVLVAANREPGRSGVEPAISQADRGAVGRGRSRSLGASAQSGLSNRRACQLLKEYPRPRQCAESRRGPFPGHARGCGYHRWPAPLASGAANTHLAWAFAFPDRATRAILSRSRAWQPVRCYGCRWGRTGQTQGTVAGQGALPARGAYFGYRQDRRGPGAGP